MRQSLFRKSIILLVIIFLLNFFGSKFYWYGILWWFDMPMHFLGGIWVTLSALFIYIFRIPLKELKLRPILIIGACSVLCVGFLWEVYEWTVQIIYPGAGLVTPLDSLSDFFFDLAGGGVALYYVIHMARKRGFLIQSTV